MIPLLTAFTWWLARPMRCIPLATEGGASIWMTRSIAPMSMPNSSDEVATSAGIRPAFRASSISRRCSRDSEPWCARATVSPASSLIAPASRSARRRLLTNSSVVRCARISSSNLGWILDQMEGATVPREAGPLGIAIGFASLARSSTGTSTVNASCFLCRASMIVTGR